MRSLKATRSITLTAILLMVAVGLFPAASLARVGSGVASAVSRSWYFAEGTTAYGFEEYVCVQNPTINDATVQLTYMLPDDQGQVVGDKFTLKSFSRATVNVAAVTPNTDVSVKVDADQGVICERSMYWGNRIEGHNSIGVMEPQETWFLAEGCTDYGFEEYISLQNPLNTNAAVNITYNTSNGPVTRPTIPLAAHARRTVVVNDEAMPPGDVSAKVIADKPIVAERSMYWDGRRGGHDSIGTETPSTQWFLAEGSTKWGFDTYILVQNPTNADASVGMTFLTENGAVNGPGLVVKAGSRQTVDARTVVGAADFSTRINANRGVVCERSMYWNNGTGKAGHDTIGVKQAADICYLAEGTTAYGFETFLLIANPNPQENDVQIQYMTPGGVEPRPGITIAPYSRVTISVNSIMPSTDVSIQVTGSYRIAAERAMYWNGRGGGHDSIGYMQNLGSN